MNGINMKAYYLTVLTSFVVGITCFVWPQNIAHAQSTSPAFSYEESYQFSEKYETHKRKKEKSATVFEKELYVGKFGNDGYFSVTLDDGAYDFSRPDPRGPSGETRFRLKLPF